VNSLFSLLTYRAFRPDPLDIDETISARFRLRKFLGITLGTNRILVISAGRTHWRVSTAEFDSAGVPTFSEPVVTPPVAQRESLIEWLREHAEAKKTECVAVGIGHGFQVTTLTAVPRLPDVENMRILRTEPARLLGDTTPGEDTNALVHHPQVESSCLRFKLRATEMAVVREVCNSAGLAIVRVVCEQAQLLELAYGAGFSDTANAGVRALLFALPSSYLFLPIDGTGWHSVTYDPATDDQAISVIIQAANQSIPPGGGSIAYINAGMPGMDDLLASLGSFAPESLVKGISNISAAAIVLN
jgi:hypothetical protein